MINNVVLVGRLTRPVDLKYTPNGVAVGTFSVACDRRYTNQLKLGKLNLKNGVLKIIQNLKF